MEEIKSPNLKTIADTAGVSISTVSRALKDHPAISEKTKNRIIEIARSLNYGTGNGAAGNGSRNKTFGIVYDPTITMHDYYFSTVIKNIVTETSMNGFQTVIKGLPDHGDMTVMMDEIEEHCGAGIIFVGDIADEILIESRERTLNAVIVDKPSRIITSVFNDNEWGVYLTTSYLIRTGCRRIALFHGPESHYFTRAITTGYRRALSEHGIPFDETLYIDGEYHITNGYEPAKRILESDIRFDGIVSNDEMASGAMKALKEKGLKIPDDVSLFGFDNLIISQHTEPQLATVDVSYEYMGRIAVRKSIENISIRESLPVQIILPVTLIPRNTVRLLENYRQV